MQFFVRQVLAQKNGMDGIGHWAPLLPTFTATQRPTMRASLLSGMPWNSKPDKRWKAPEPTTQIPAILANVRAIQWSDALMRHQRA